MHKRKTKMFGLIVGIAMATIPAINLAQLANGAKFEPSIFRDFYNLDVVATQISHALYPFGISIDPNSAVIGYDGWFYLGDGYKRTISLKRRPENSGEKQRNTDLINRVANWEAFMVRNGVRVLKIMIAPDTSSIYPEFTPRWARPVAHTAIDDLLEQDRRGTFVDLRTGLRKAKKQFPFELYIKTDTHWNALGAEIGFQQFARQAAQVLPEIRWPADRTLDFKQVNPRQNGGLATFIRIRNNLADTEPASAVPFLAPTTGYFSYPSLQPIANLKNLGTTIRNSETVVISPGALNKLRVLWIRDLFGSALELQFATTFSDVLQIHPLRAFDKNSRLKEVIQNWRPELVFVTVVERNARGTIFTSLP